MQKRPTAAIMGDDWFGHRDPLTYAKAGNSEEYTAWDWAILNAFQTIEDLTDDKSGLLVWEMEDDSAYVTADRKTNKFEAARDKKTQAKNYKPIPGEYYVPGLKSHRVDDDGNYVFQTMRQWMEKEIQQGK